MSILVTGGAGFIGSHFIEQLLRDTEQHIVCLDNFNDYYDPALKRANARGFVDNPRVTMVEESFCDVERMKKLLDNRDVEYIVHLGAYAGVRYSVTNPMVYQENNVRGTLALLEAARHHPVNRFLLTSSSTAYGRGAAIPFVEDAPLGAPMSPYGATKRSAELFGLTYCDLHAVPVVCLRPFSVYGPRIRPDLAVYIFADAVINEKTLPLFGDGSMKRDYTHVSDICDGFFSALTADGVIGEIINLGNNEPISTKDLLSAIEEAVGKKAIIEQQPEKPGEMFTTFADLTKAKRLLDYQPKMSFADGIRDYVKWFKTHKVGTP